MAHDWLVGGNRGALAADRIYAAATDVIARHGFDGLDMDALAERVHCSRATLYRHAGGKAQIRDAVLTRAATRITDTVRRAVDGRTGCDRVLTAITMALEETRSDPIAAQVIKLGSGQRAGAALAESPALARFAAELGGLDDDPAAAHWVVRIVLSLLFWPGSDNVAEAEMLQRFVAPAFGD